MRIGIGYDAHPLSPNRKLIIGGINIPFNKGLSGHSDADVLTHAIIDALLGAAGLRDIGSHFPAGEPEFKDISSLKLLDKVGSMLKKGRYEINNIDATIIAQEPRMSPFIDEMRSRLSQTLGIDLSQITIKATTTNGLGFIGRQEGIAALSVAMINEEKSLGSGSTD